MPRWNLKKMRPSLSIKVKIFWSFVFAALLSSLAIGISAYHISGDVVTDKVFSSIMQTVEHIGGNLRRELQEIKNYSDYIFADEDLQEAIMDRERDPYNHMLAEKRFLAKLNNYMTANTFQAVRVIKFWGDNGYRQIFGNQVLADYYDDERIRNDPACQEALTGASQMVSAGTGTQFIKDGESEVATWSVMRALRDPYFKYNIGSFYMSVDLELFTELTEKFNENGMHYYIIDERGSILGEPPPGREERVIRQIWEQFSQREENTSLLVSRQTEGFFCCMYQSDYMRWSVIGLIPVQEVVKDNNQIVTAAAISFLISFLIAVLIWYVICSNLVRPLLELTEASKEIRKGNLKVRVPSRTRDEVGILSDHFNHMAEEMDSMVKRLIEEEIKKKDAQYQALQAQIHPHFLYNTLNTIRWMSMMQNVPNIKRMVEALSTLLSSSAGKENTLITIEEELKTLEDYIYIEKIAYKNKFMVQWQIADAIRPYGCIRFLLQPIVENAIFHGIQPKEEAGTIVIRGELEADRIRFSIKDDGVGIDPGECKRSAGHFNGIGLENIRERLELFYQGGAAMEIQSERGCYTEVTISFPAEYPKGYEQFRNRPDPES